MTYGNETNPDQEKIEAAFEMLVSAQNAVSHVVTVSYTHLTLPTILLV